MSQSQSIKGFWWSPDDPEKRWFGVLEQTPGSGIELTCHSDTGDVELVQGKPGVTVHGQDEKDRPVTLLVVSRAGTTKSGGMTTVRLRPGYVLVGTHVPDREAVQVKTLDLRLQHLYGWLGMTGFNRKVDANLSGTVAIAYDRPEWEPHQVRPGLKIEFGLATSYSAGFQTQSINEEAAACMTSETGLSFRGCWDMSTAFRTLLHLAILKPVYSVSMAFREERGEDLPPNEITVWSPNLREAKTEPPVEGYWVFRYADFEADFGGFFARWLDYREQYSEALNCYTTTVYHRLPRTVEHLCLTQALDAYHGVRFASHHRRDFKKKVEELCGLREDALAGLVDDIPPFAEAVRDTRDYYTHHNPDDLANRGVVQSHTDLTRLNERLAILFQSCVLTDIGVPSDRLVCLRRRLATEIVEY